MTGAVSCCVGYQVKEVIKPIIGECSYCPDDKFLMNLSLTLSDTVNLADRYSHGRRQLGQILILIVAHLKNSCFHNHERAYK